MGIAIFPKDSISNELSSGQLIPVLSYYLNGIFQDHPTLLIRFRILPINLTNRPQPEWVVDDILELTKPLRHNAMLCYLVP